MIGGFWIECRFMTSLSFGTEEFIYQNAEMEQIFMAAKEVFQDEKGISVRVSNFVGPEEDDHACFSASELKMEFEKMISRLRLDLDIRQLNNQRCTKESCPCGNKLTSPEYIGSGSRIQNLAWCCIDPIENGTSDSLGRFCGTTSLCNLPGNLRISEVLFENLNRKKRSKSIKDMGDFIVEYSAASNSGTVIISPWGRWILDSIESTLIARALLKSSLLFQLGTRDKATNHVRSRSVNSRQITFSELTRYPSELYDTALQNSKWDVIPFEKKRSKSNITEKMLLSCSSSNSSCSHQSTSSAHRCVSKGMLRCVWKGGIPYFEFSLDDDLGEVYVANPQKIDSPVDKAPDYVYLFHSKTYGKKDSRIRDNNSLGVVGKMKVTSSLVLSSNRSRSIETEFVLIGAHDDHSRTMHGSTSTPTKSKGLSKKVAEIFRSSHSFKHKSSHKIGEPSSENFWQEAFIGELNDIESGALNHLAHDFPPNLELAAIVVKDYRHNSDKEVVGGGWGLKFLEKADVSHPDASREPSVSKVCEESCTGDRRESARNIHVLIPAGFHGGPVTKIGGPSSLTERWRSGGHCDCGGWDIGCPLTVLNNNSETSLHTESQEDCKSVNLLIEGADHDEPVLKMVNTNEDLYFVYFQSSLSALQSFSIGVAIIHTQTPDLYPKL